MRLNRNDALDLLIDEQQNQTTTTNKNYIKKFMSVLKNKT